MNPNTCIRIEVRGVVQGVGFRPFVLRLALNHQLKGFVLNDSNGVSIQIEGPPETTRQFLNDLRTTPPPAAHISSIETQELPLQNFSNFEIRKSLGVTTHRSVPVSADLNVCQDCLHELWDPKDRRHLYPFINCTNCGPRFTIVKDVPYDRPNTTMSAFPMCQQCRLEYEDPLDRRYHAQPIACPQCGPNLKLHDQTGCEVAPSPENTGPNNLILKCCEFLRAGKIIALKGLGGFHLCCDARNEVAVARLRSRKHREMKPFGVMFTDLQAAAEYAVITETEISLLSSMASPIVLLEKHATPQLAPSVAPRNKRLGVMLPTTPLHELLLKTFTGPLVMTSGNQSDEPIVTTDSDAFERLQNIADYFLTHNRPIETRCDDSVVKVSNDKPIILRRSRGYAPGVLNLEQPFSAAVFATGAELKNTFCLTRGHQAILSHHLGNLDHLETMRSFEEGFSHFKKLFGITPQVIAHDLHPDYLNTKWVKENFSGPEWSGRVFGIQHHHAHIVSCLTENNHQGLALGLALDGTGYGLDGTIWGGELLLCDERDFIRAGHLRTFALPGGDQAIHQPWRTALALINQILPSSQVPEAIARVFPEISPDKTAVILQMLASNLNCPVTSSCGRLFDGVSALLGCTREVFYEGQAAIELEQLLDGRAPATQPGYCFDLNSTPQGSELDWRPAINALYQDVINNSESALLSRKFHDGLNAGLCQMALVASEKYRIKTVALSGGCFQNDYLREDLSVRLEKVGLTVLFHKSLPTGDGGLALGQAVIADRTYTRTDTRTYKGDASCVWQFQ